MIRQTVKNALLPKGNRVRRLPAGIGRGLRIHVDFHRGETGLYLGLYEVEVNRHLRRIAKRGFRSFDVGGHFGYDALVLAKLTGGPVLSLESEEPFTAEIRRNVAENPGLGPIEVETAFVADGGEGTVSIDQLAERHGVPDLLKIDIEGGELEALRGATTVLADRGPAILLEVHSAELERTCSLLLAQAGYPLPTIVDRRRVLADHRPTEHNRWLVYDER